MMFHPCKITVVKKGYDGELVNNYVKNPERMKICDRVEHDQEFFVNDPWEKPENMCASAWADIRPFIITIASGGNFDFMTQENSTLATCTDPFRPVIFKIEIAK